MTIRLFALAALAAVTLAACGTHPKDMAAEDAAALSDRSLCSWYADQQSGGYDAPELLAEYERRGLDCSREVARVVSDCSKMRLVSIGQHPSHANVYLYEVRNDFPSPRDFRIRDRGYTSEGLTIGGRSTKGFAMVSSPGSALAGVLIAAAGMQPPPEIRLVDCVVPR